MASLRSSRGHGQLHVKDYAFVHACQGFFYTAAIPSAAAARSSLLLPTTPCDVCFRRSLAFPITLSIIGNAPGATWLGAGAFCFQINKMLLFIGTYKRGGQKCIGKRLLSLYTKLDFIHFPKMEKPCDIST